MYVCILYYSIICTLCMYNAHTDACNMHGECTVQCTHPIGGMDIGHYAYCTAMYHTLYHFNVCICAHHYTLILHLTYMSYKCDNKLISNIVNNFAGLLDTSNHVCSKSVGGRSHFQHSSDNELKSNERFWGYFAPWWFDFSIVIQSSNASSEFFNSW